MEKEEWRIVSRVLISSAIEFTPECQRRAEEAQITLVCGEDAGFSCSKVPRVTAFLRKPSVSRHAVPRPKGCQNQHVIWSILFYPPGRPDSGRRQIFRASSYHASETRHPR